MKISTFILFSCISLLTFGQPNMVTLSADQLRLDQSMESSGKYIQLTNVGGANVLSNYPVRPEYSFDGPEMIYALPKMSGHYNFYIDPNGRIPDDEVDIFVLTNPNNANSAIRWMNGTGVLKQMNMSENENYYLVVDGFQNTSATLNFAAVVASPPPTFCNTSNDPIDLNNFLMNGPKGINDTWTRLSGSGGSFDNVSGIFTPTPGNTTTSVFELKRDFNNPQIATTEDITLVFDGSACVSIPTLSQWGSIVLGLIMLILGVVALRRKSLVS